MLSGDRTAFISGERRLSFADFDARTNRLARALKDELDVCRGDRVAGLLINSVEFMEVLFATAKLGAIFVPINVRLAAGEVSFILANSGADVFIYHEVHAGVARESSGPGVRHRVQIGQNTGQELSYEDLVQSGSDESIDMDIDPRDIHAIMYTSGTTGRPKGAVLTHANAIANARNMLTVGRGMSERDVTVTVAPMFHIGGLGVHSLPFIYIGATNVIQASFDPAATLRAMAEEHATVEFMVPAMWAALMRVPEFDSFDLSSLDMALSGGAPTPLTVIEFFRARGVPFQEAFGMTETAPLVSVLDAAHIESKAGSIGRAALHVDARIVDDDDRSVASDVVGELVLRGENVFAGYWMLPKETAEAFRGGWFHTGDLGRMDDEGFVTLVDRKKDMIISGGENVYPVEVEQVLYRHPDIREVAVFGVPDPRWGETVVAAVALEASRTVEGKELIAYCYERLAHFKCPTRVEFVEELPRNATGKVLKTKLRATYGQGSTAVSR